MIGKKAKLTKKEGKIGRGRKKLDLDNSVLFDAFSEKVPGDRCRLKLYVEQDSGELKAITEPKAYPYDLGT